MIRSTYVSMLLYLITLSGCMTDFNDFIPFIVVSFGAAIIIGLVAVFNKDKETSEKAGAFAFAMLITFLILIVLG